MCLKNNQNWDQKGRYLSDQDQTTGLINTIQFYITAT